MNKSSYQFARAVAILIYTLICFWIMIRPDLILLRLHLKAHHKPLVFQIGFRKARIFRINGPQTYYFLIAFPIKFLIFGTLTFKFVKLL